MIPSSSWQSFHPHPPSSLIGHPVSLLYTTIPVGQVLTIKRNGDVCVNRSSPMTNVTQDKLMGIRRQIKLSNSRIGYRYFLLALPKVLGNARFSFRNMCLVPCLHSLTVDYLIYKIYVDVFVD